MLSWTGRLKRRHQNTHRKSKGKEHLKHICMVVIASQWAESCFQGLPQEYQFYSDSGVVLSTTPCRIKFSPGAEVWSPGEDPHKSGRESTVQVSVPAWLQNILSSIRLLRREMQVQLLWTIVHSILPNLVQFTLYILRCWSVSLAQAHCFVLLRCMGPFTQTKHMLPIHPSCVFHFLLILCISIFQRCWINSLLLLLHIEYGPFKKIYMHNLHNYSNQGGAKPVAIP